MNDYLIKELFTKHLEAQAKDTHYNFFFSHDEFGWTVGVKVQPEITGYKVGSYTISRYQYSYLETDPRKEEKELNYAISYLNQFIKYGELYNGPRMAMYHMLVKKSPEHAADIADYLNLDPELMKQVSA